MIKHSKLSGGYEHTVTVADDERTATVYTRIINPATGHGWQAHRDLKHYEGEKAKALAMRDWCYRGTRIVKRS